MAGQLSQVVRWLAGILALVTALAAVIQALVFVEFSQPVLVLGVLGAARSRAGLPDAPG